MRPVFVKTENVSRFTNAMTALSRRGAQESCLIVLDGMPGLGKTTTLQHWVAQNSCVYLRAKKEWTSSWFMRELLENMRVIPPHSIQQKYNMALQELGSRHMLAANTGKDFALVIDEADHVSSNSRIIETIRDLSDMLEVPIVLVGMGKIRTNLTKFPQVSSRVSQFVRFDPASLADVTKFTAEMCEVEVAEDLVHLIHKISGGFNREIKNALANVERFGLRNQPEDGGISIGDMAGQFLINDRQTGTAIHVPEVM